jgi:hypothetical protein
MTVKNLDPQTTAPARAPKSADKAGSYSLGETPAGEGEDEFAAILNDEEMGGELAFDPESLVPPSGVPTQLMGDTAFAEGFAPLEGAPGKGMAIADGPTPKVMDASLIEQVNNAIAPEGGGEAAGNGPFLDLSGKAAGRSPAIDLDKPEVDPQLMDMQDFVAQRNAFARKQLPTQAYGMPIRVPASMTDAGPLVDMQKPFAKAQAAEGDLTIPQMPMSKPDAIPMWEKPDTVSASGKVFDMNALKGKPMDADSIISQIQDYVVQARASKEPTVEMKMQHQDLGLLNITVHKAQDNMVNIAIRSADQGANLFLGQHRDQLLGHLGQAGVNVGELKMDVQANASKENMSGQGQQPGHGQERQFGSEQNQRREEQQRRQDLWSLLSEKEVA